MEVTQVLHMNKGAGENSYAQNSSFQRKIISITKPATEEAIRGVLASGSAASMCVADLGCSSGPNVLSVISHIVSTVRAKCRKMGRSPPELTLYLNDLPCNDFNILFGSLPEFYDSLKAEAEAANCFVMAVPGSFYGRLFPSHSLHLVHSSSSLHWLSQVPPGLESEEGRALNKGSVYITKRSSRRVVEAYSMQFRKDFSEFLRLRSAEMVSGGRMVLSFMGRRSADPRTEDDDYCCYWEFLSRALMSMVSQGRLEEERVDSFNTPFHAPSPEELRAEIEGEGSFGIDRLEAFEVDWDIVGGDNSTIISNSADQNDSKKRLQKLANGKGLAKMVRAVAESMLEYHFNFEGDAMDDLFRRCSEISSDHFLKTKRAIFVNLVLSLIKKDKSLINNHAWT